MQRTASTHPRRAFRGLPLLAVALAGCATASSSGPLPVWPPPPAKARIQFVRSLRSDRDLDPPLWRRVFRAIIPAQANLGVAQPSGLALSPDEQRLYMAGAATGWVLEFDFKERTLRRVAQDGGFTPAHPAGVAVDGEGRLYVSDSRGRHVYVFDRDGKKMLRRFGEQDLERPTGLALDRKRQVLFVVDGSSKDSENHRIVAYSLQGEKLFSFGRRGTGPGEFFFPTHVALDSEGRIFVSDLLNARVQVFDGTGQLAGSFGSSGRGYGNFGKPKGIGVDTFGNIYVGDGEFSHVQVFNPRFQPLMIFGGRSTDPGFLLLPSAIVIDSRNHIFVADWAFNRINEYALVNTTAEDSVSSTGPVGATPGPQ